MSNNEGKGYTTQSGREIRKVGQQDRSSALAQLRAAREGGEKRTAQYQVDEGNRIFEEIGDEEYERLQDRRRNDDFIVDDDGLGYRDHGGEIWEGDDDEDEQANKYIFTFMMPQSTIKKKGVPAAAKQQAKPKVTEEQSRDMLNNLLGQLDNKEAEELEDINSSAVLAELNKPIAFSKEEQLYNKYNVPLTVQPQIPAVEQTASMGNIFSKKRKADEISAQEHAYCEQAVNVSEYHSAHDESKMEIDASAGGAGAAAVETPQKGNDDWHRFIVESDKLLQEE